MPKSLGQMLKYAIDFVGGLLRALLSKRSK